MIFNFLKAPFDLVKLAPKTAFVLLILSLLSGIIQTIAIFSIFPLIDLYNLLPLDRTGKFVVTLYHNYILKTFLLKNSLEIVLLFLFIFILISSSINFFVRYQASKISTVIVRNLRLKFIQSTLQSNWSYFLNKKTGEIVNVIINEAGKTTAGYVDSVNFFSNLMQGAIIFIVTFLISFEVSFYSIIVAIIYLIIFKNMGQKARKYGVIATSLLKKITINMTDNYKNIKPLKATGKSDYLIKLLNNQVNLTQKNDFRLILTSIIPEYFKEPVFAFFIALGVYLALNFDIITLSSLLTMVALFQRSMAKFSLSYIQYITIKKIEPFYHSYNNNLNESLKYKEQHYGKKIHKFDNNIKFENVSFNYLRKKILNNISFDINKGSFINISGISGSGKTTLIDLITKLHDPSNGSISVDGINLNEYDIQHWRQDIGYVTQEQFFFNDTVLNNLTLGREGVKYEEIEYALKVSHSYDFLKKEENFLDTIMGESGLKFSGGQRQRLSLARAILFRPKILILDEATSAMDKKTELLIFENLKNMQNKNLTIISICHNKDHLNFTDITYELEDGQLLKIS